jgi:nitrite reductase/ring-hydroxylating ferredoxin subunit
MKEACKESDPTLTKQGWKSFDCFGGKTCLVLKDDNGYHGFVNVCPHMSGTTIPFEEADGTKILKCTYHAGEFDILTGKRLSGLPPDGSGLRTLEIKVENGIIYYS